MTRLLDLNDYAIGLPAIGPNVDAAYADERRWDEAADRAADLMQDAEAIAQYADDGGRDVSLPADPVQEFLDSKGMKGAARKNAEVLLREFINFTQPAAAAA